MRALAGRAQVDTVAKIYNLWFDAGRMYGYGLMSVPPQLSTMPLAASAPTPMGSAAQFAASAHNVSPQVHMFGPGQPAVQVVAAAFPATSAAMQSAPAAGVKRPALTDGGDGASMSAGGGSGKEPRMLSNSDGSAPAGAQAAEETAAV